MTDEKIFDKIVDAHKSRQNLMVVLFVSLMTANGYAIESGNPAIFYIASLIPISAFILDTITKYTYISPFLYVALADALRGNNEQENLALLFLDYGKGDKSDYVVMFKKLEAGPERQIEFRRKYTLRNFVGKALFFISLFCMQILFGLILDGYVQWNL